MPPGLFFIGQSHESPQIRVHDRSERVMAQPRNPPQTARPVHKKGPSEDGPPKPAEQPPTPKRHMSPRSLLRLSMQAPTAPARSPSFESLIVVSLFTSCREYLLMALLSGSMM